MRPLTTPRADLGFSEPPAPDETLAACSRSGVALVRQLARHVRARLGEGGATPFMGRHVLSGRAFVEFVDSRFGVRKLSNVKEKHVRAWFEDLRARGTDWREVQGRGDSLAALGIVRPARIRRIVSTIRAR